MRYVNMDKPSYNPKTEIITPDYKIEDGTFISGWKVEKKPDEDGYIPTQEEQNGNTPTIRERITLLETTTNDMILLMAELIGGV